MSGHSKFANIKHKKEKNDAAKGKIFTIIGREIAVAVKEATSLLFSDMRFSTDELISASGIGLCPEPGTVISAPALFFPVATVSSTIVFHSPHAGHRPIHLGLSFPHSLQNHTLLVLTVAILEIFFSCHKSFHIISPGPPSSLLPARRAQGHHGHTNLS